MTYIIIALGIIVAVALIIMMRNNVTQRKDLLRLRQEIEKEKERLAFLINNNFEVKDTNYYHLMTKMKDDQPNILGNVLHCTNGCDAGLCGTGDACKTCPVRLVIRNSFEQRRDFEKVEAKMSLYDENHNRQEVGVKADGHIVCVNGDPYMMIKLKTVPLSVVKETPVAKTFEEAELKPNFGKAPAADPAKP